MLAVIMAGGQGTRLGLGEKTLVQILDRPMISFVIDAFEEAGLDTVIIAAPGTPYTQNWCRARGISLIRAGGRGYIEDLTEAVKELDITAPFFTCGGDLPCITPNLIRRIRSAYEGSSRDACSVWVPLNRILSFGLTPSFVEQIDGIEASPAGINILLGEKIGNEQDELRLLIDDPALALNVNTRKDLRAAAEFLAEKKGS